MLSFDGARSSDGPQEILRSAPPILLIKCAMNRSRTCQNGKAEDAVGEDFRDEKVHKLSLKFILHAHDGEWRRQSKEKKEKFSSYEPVRSDIGSNDQQ